MKEMRAWFLDMAKVPASTVVLGEEMIITNGFNRPRYVNPRGGFAGFLGFKEWEVLVPQVNSEIAGSLDKEKYYSFKVVPQDSKRSYLASPVLTGPPTYPTKPYNPSISGGIRVDVPSHPDRKIFWAGKVADGSVPWWPLFNLPGWGTNEHAGRKVYNVTTGRTYELGDNGNYNSDQTLYVAPVEGETGAFTTGDKVEIFESACNRRLIYAAEMTSPSDVDTASYHYQGYIDNNDEEIEDGVGYYYDFTEFSASGVFPEDIIQPPTAVSCESDGRRIFLAGGLPPSQKGTGWVDITERTRTATGVRPMLFEVVGFYWTSEGFTKIMRLYLDASEATRFTVEQVYSRITIEVGDGEDKDNNVTDAKIISVDPEGTWVEYLNPTGVPVEAVEDADVTTKPNVLHATGMDLHEGCVGHTVTFDGENGYHTIASVDVVKQTAVFENDYSPAAAGWATSPSNAKDATLSSELDIYYSDIGDPNTYSLANTKEISGNPRKLVRYTNALLIFTDSDLFLIGLDEFDAAMPEHVCSGLSITAPFGIAASQSDGVLFWDGAGFSVTDGIQTRSITNDKCRWLMDEVNVRVAGNIRAIWNSHESRWEVAFARGTSVTNDYGLYITSDYRIYGTMRLDVNAMWEDVDDDGAPEIRHGTSSRHIGNGTVWRHSHELFTDGNDSINLETVTRQCKWTPDSEAVDEQLIVQITNKGDGTQRLTIPQVGDGIPSYMEPFGIIPKGSQITISGALNASNDVEAADVIAADINGYWVEYSNPGGVENTMEYTALIEIVKSGQTGILMYVESDAAERTFTASSNNEVLVYPGTPIAILSQQYGLVYTLIESLVELTPGEEQSFLYQITFPSDWGNLLIKKGDVLFVGGIPFVYGPRWKDFESPQYRHHIRHTEMDIEPTSGIIITDHYANLDESRIVASEEKLVYENDTKLVFRFLKGPVYQYGFRIRGICMDKVLIDGFSTLFDTIV